MTVPLKAFRTSALAALLCAAAHAQGTLVIVDPTINGDTVSLPIHLQGAVSDGVAAMDFQLAFDSAILQPVQVVAGAAAAQAGKTVQAEVLQNGLYSVLMFGGGLSGVSKGEVARVSLAKIAEPKSGETAVAITGTKFSTISSVEIPSLGSTTTLLFEQDSDDGDSGSLPPIPGGGAPPPLDSPPPPSGGAVGVDPPKESKGNSPAPSSGGAPLDLAGVRAAADIQIANMRRAQAEREAARAELEGRPAAESGGANVVRVRQSTSRGGDAAADLRASAPLNEGAAPHSGGPSATEPPQPPSRLAQAEPSGDSGTVGAAEPTRVFQGPGAGESSEMAAMPATRGLWMRAAVLAACIAAALGLFAYQRRV